MKALTSQNKGKAVLTTGIILVALVLIVFAGVASASSPDAGGVEGHLEHIASDLCAMGSSVKLISYAAIALVLIKLVELIVSFKKGR